MMHVAETREKAMADAAWGFREFNDYTHDVVPAPPAIPRDTADIVGAAIEKQVAIIGTPDDANNAIERVREKLGGFGAVLLFGNDLAPWPAQCRSFELIAEFVKPHFARANVLRQASYDATAQAIGELRQGAMAASNAATIRTGTFRRPGSPRSAAAEDMIERRAAISAFGTSQTS
jgi:limonene 1,2-monooxygenase